MATPDMTQQSNLTPAITVDVDASAGAVEVNVLDGLVDLEPMSRVDLISDAIYAMQQLYDRAYEEAFPGRAARLRSTVRLHIASAQVSCELLVGKLVSNVTFTRKGECHITLASGEELTLRGLPDPEGNHPVFGTNEDLERAVVEPMDLVFSQIGLPPPSEIPMLTGAIADR